MFLRRLITVTSRDFAIHSSWDHFGGKKRWKREDFESQGQVCRIAVSTHGRAGGFSEMTRKQCFILWPFFDFFFLQAPSCWWTRPGDLRDREPTSSYLSWRRMTPTALIFTTLCLARVILPLGHSTSTWRSIMGLWGALSGIYLETLTVHGIGQNWPSVPSGLTFIRYALYFSFPVLKYPLTSENINHFFISLIGEWIRSIGIFRPR